MVFPWFSYAKIQEVVTSHGGHGLDLCSTASCAWLTWEKSQHAAPWLGISGCFMNKLGMLLLKTNGKPPCSPLKTIENHWTWLFLLDFPMSNGDFCCVRLPDGKTLGMLLKIHENPHVFTTHTLSFSLSLSPSQRVKQKLKMCLPLFTCISFRGDLYWCVAFLLGLAGEIQCAD